MKPELIAGATTTLRNTIRPLAYPQPHWDGHKAQTADPLYQRVRQALTATTSQSGGGLTASKAPARIDILAWLCQVDSMTAVLAPNPAITTLRRLQDIHDHTWTPDQLGAVKTFTKAAEHWVTSAKELLGDTAPAVPLRRHCPACDQMWHVHADTRVFALKAVATMDDWHAICGACKTVWYTPAEKALFLRMLNLDGHADEQTTTV